MSKKAIKPTQKKPSKRLVIGLSVGIPLAILLGIGLLTGWVQYSVAYAGCGWKQPVIYNNYQDNFVGGKNYYVLPADSTDPDYKHTLNSEYFCSEADAISKGYKIDPSSGTGIERSK